MSLSSPALGGAPAPPLLGTEVPALTQGSAETQAQGLLFMLRLPAQMLTQRPSFISPARAFPGLPVNQGRRALPGESKSFPPTPMGPPHALTPPPRFPRQAGRQGLSRAGLSQPPLDGTPLNS